jgi:hypothetical protein
MNDLERLMRNCQLQPRTGLNPAGHDGDCNGRVYKGSNSLCASYMSI